MYKADFQEEGLAGSLLVVGLVHSMHVGNHVRGSAVGS